MAVGDLRLPPAPPIKITRPDGETVVTTNLEFVPEVGEPTPQARKTDELGGPLEALATCRFCGGMHPSICPYIRTIEWHPSGQVALVRLEERAAQKTAILYPFEEEQEGNLDVLRRALTAIKDGLPPERAQELAGTLLKMFDDTAEPSA